MFEPCVLGVDPGMASVGIAAVGRRDRRPVLLGADTIRTAPALAEAARLRVIHERVREAIAEHHPSSISVERVAWNTNQVSALRVARATAGAYFPPDASIRSVQVWPRPVKTTAASRASS